MDLGSVERRGVKTMGAGRPRVAGPRRGGGLVSEGFAAGMEGGWTLRWWVILFVHGEGARGEEVWSFASAALDACWGEPIGDQAHARKGANWIRKLVEKDARQNHRFFAVPTCRWLQLGYLVLLRLV